MLVVRQDPIELTGKVVLVNSPFAGQPGTSPSGQWTFVVKPDPATSGLAYHTYRQHKSGSQPCLHRGGRHHA